MFTALHNWIAKKSPAYIDLQTQEEAQRKLNRHWELQVSRLQQRVAGLDEENARHQVWLQEATDDAKQRTMGLEAKLKERDDRIAWLERIVKGWEPERKALLEQLSVARVGKFERRATGMEGRSGIVTDVHPNINNHFIVRQDISVSEDCFRHHPDPASQVRYIGEQAAYELEQALRRHLLEKGITVL